MLGASYGFIVVKKRHLYTGEVNLRMSKEGFVVLVKKFIIGLARDIPTMIDVHEPNCLGGEMRLMPTGMARQLGHKKNSQILTNNNDFHNNTDCIT